MGMMTTLRNRMHVVLWALLALFILSMTVGGLVGGANIIDQLLGRVSPSEAIGAVNGSLITPDQFNHGWKPLAIPVRKSLISKWMQYVRKFGTHLLKND